MSEGLLHPARSLRNIELYLALKFKYTYMYCIIRMPTRSLTIKEEAYRALKARKKEGESFTDVILRLTGNKGSAKRLLEMMDELHSPELASRVEEASKDFRKNFKTRDVML